MKFIIFVAQIRAKVYQEECQPLFSSRMSTCRENFMEKIWLLLERAISENCQISVFPPKTAASRNDPNDL